LAADERAFALAQPLRYEAFNLVHNNRCAFIPYELALREARRSRLTRIRFTILER
jgi:hypothetical protein